MGPNLTLRNTKGRWESKSPWGQRDLRNKKPETASNSVVHKVWEVILKFEIRINGILKKTLTKKNPNCIL